jgi:hypothetical protein
MLPKPDCAEILFVGVILSLSKDWLLINASDKLSMTRVNSKANKKIVAKAGLKSPKNYYFCFSKNKKVLPLIVVWPHLS